MSEPLMRLLATLPTTEPDPMRAERIRRSCRARLVRDAARTARSTITITPMWRLAISVLGAAYLIDAIVEAVRVYSL